jgi:hypothetical protein
VWIFLRKRIKVFCVFWIHDSLLELQKAGNWLLRCWEGSGVSVVKGKALGLHKEKLPCCLSQSETEQEQSSLKFTLRLADGLHPELNTCPQADISHGSPRRKWSSSSQDDLGFCLYGWCWFILCRRFDCSWEWLRSWCNSLLLPHPTEREWGGAWRVETGCGSQTCSPHSNPLISFFALTPRSWVHSWENLEPVWVCLAHIQPASFFVPSPIGNPREQEYLPLFSHFQVLEYCDALRQRCWGRSLNCLALCLALLGYLQKRMQGFTCLSSF